MKLIRHSLKRGVYVLNVFLFTCCCKPASAGELFINVGARGTEAEFGYGWGQPQRNRGHRYAWIRNHLEADIWIELDNEASADFEIMAAAYHAGRRQQALGLYINNRFAGEWVFPQAEGMEFEHFSCVIPFGMLKPGRNRITLRTGHTGPKGHAVAVDWIRLNLHESAAK